MSETIAEKWDATFAKLGRSAPAQRADEATADYQRRLARVGRKYIPAGEEIARVRPSAAEWRALAASRIRPHAAFYAVAGGLRRSILRRRPASVYLRRHYGCTCGEPLSGAISFEKSARIGRFPEPRAHHHPN
jgi:hypothetical protein